MRTTFFLTAANPVRSARRVWLRRSYKAKKRLVGERRRCRLGNRSAGGRRERASYAVNDSARCVALSSAVV